MEILKSSIKCDRKTLDTGSAFILLVSTNDEDVCVLFVAEDFFKGKICFGIDKSHFLNLDCEAIAIDWNYTIYFGHLSQ